MLADIFAPLSDWGLLILRVALGLIFIAHGWPKLNPNSPMKGTAGLAGFLAQLKVPAPAFFAWVLALLETLGALLLILGPFTRLIALGAGHRHAGGHPARQARDGEGAVHGSQRRGLGVRVRAAGRRAGAPLHRPGAIALRWAAGW